MTAVAGQKYFEQESNAPSTTRSGITLF